MRFLRSLFGTPRPVTHQESEARSVAGLRAIAKDCIDGSVVVLDRSGRKTVPTELAFSASIFVDNVCPGTAFLTTPVRIDGTAYTFSAYLHGGPVTKYSSPRLYYDVTGPSRADGRRGEFQITTEFRWTGDRPWNPMLVKFALREWAVHEEVLASVGRAKIAYRRLKGASGA